MHDEIIRFNLEGEIADINIVQQRERLINFVESQMRDSGAVPSLDLDPQFTLDYNGDSETYTFNLTVYGIYVGSEQAWQSAGVESGRTMSKYMAKAKSKVF